MRIKEDSFELFSSRRTFRDIAEVFEQNKQLQELGGYLWDWIRTLYASYVVMRVRRETDNQGNTINLHQLLKEIKTRSDVVTRGRFFEMLNLPKGDYGEKAAQQYFTRTWMPNDSSDSANPADKADPSRVLEDCEFLQNAAERVREVANRDVAHRVRVDANTLTIPEVDAAFDAIEVTLTKYYALLHGSTLMQAEPAPQFDTHSVFTFPWIERKG